MNTRDTTHAQRVRIVEQHLAGETLSTIATDMELNFYTVRTWWRVYRREGWEGLLPRPSGPPVTGALSEFDDLVKYVALRLKCEHPAWGLDVLLLHMRRRPSLAGKRLPKRTALYNYLKPYYAKVKPLLYWAHLMIWLLLARFLKFHQFLYFPVLSLILFF